MATGGKRESTQPSRLNYSGLGLQTEERRPLGVNMLEPSVEPLPSSSGATSAPPPPPPAEDRKSKSSHSSSSSKLRQVDLKMKRDVMNVTQVYEDKKDELEDKLVDLKRRLENATDEEVIQLDNELKEVEVQIPRLKRNFLKQVRNIQEAAELDKEEIQIEIEDDQFYDTPEVEADNAVVTNWLHSQAYNSHEEPVVPVPPQQQQFVRNEEVPPEYRNVATENVNIIQQQRQVPDVHATVRFEGNDPMPPYQVLPVPKAANFERQNYRELPRAPSNLYERQQYEQLPPPPPLYNYGQHQHPQHASGNAAADLARALKDACKELRGEREWEPKDLPTFNGKAEDWPIFIGEFNRTTPAGKVNSSQNAIRLRRSLKGTAKDAVAGLLNEPNNVQRIMLLLEKRFGRGELVITTLIKKAEECKPVDAFKPESFVDFATTVIHLVETVKSMGNATFLNDSTLLSKLIMKLPMTLASEWLDFVAANPLQPNNLDTFGGWAERKMERLVCLVNPVIKEDRDQKGRGIRGSAHVHVASTEAKESKEDRSQCPCCDRNNHHLRNCFKFKKLPVKERSEIVRKSGRCFLCLNDGHMKKDCKSDKMCGKDNCNSSHHFLLHYDYPKKRSNEDSSSSSQDISFQNDDGGMHIGAVQSSSSKPLSIVRVKVRGEKGIRRVYALLDSGADTTVMEADLAKELGIHGKKTRTSCKGVGGIKQQISGEEINFEVAGAYKKAKFYSIQQAVTHPNLGLSPYSQDVKIVKEKWPYLKKAKLETFVGVIPRMIIGEDHPFITAHRQLLERGENEPIAKRTLLGWVVGGREVGERSSETNIHTLSTEDGKYLDSILRSNFSLDSFGVYPKCTEDSVEDLRALEMLNETVRRVDDVWECGLLWRDPYVKLPESRSDAVSRLLSNERRMKKDKVFAEMYHAKMEEYLAKGYIHELSPEEVKTTTDKTLYIPHFGVFNVNKPGKLRLVFDAANRNGSVSMNEHLLTGPDLIRPLPTVLMNFRRHNVVINGDIEDMFHRVRMRKEDRESQRFLFRSIKEDGNPIRTFTMDVLIFGACSSPASAIFVKNKNAEEYADKYPNAAAVIKEDFYCDDCLTGAKTVEEAIELCRQIIEINAAGNFAVKKWLSNRKEVVLSIPEVDRAAGLKGFGEKAEMPTERILGLWYSPEEDVFTFSANLKKVDPSLLEGRHPSKREMCRVIMSVFDPLGFLANFKIKGLILLQQTWRSGVDWDDEIPDSTYDHWKTWIWNLKETEKVKIPRVYCYDIHLSKSIELHILVDASEEACCTICFLRVKIGECVTVSFVCAKTKVAPTKKLTMPRLELTAAVMGANLADKIVEELEVNIDSRYFWSDSKTVLMWIRSETLRFKEFVANRISRIHLLTSAAEWRWIPTALNVADQGTRLQSKIEFSPHSLWFVGPLFLQEEPDAWPTEDKGNKEKDECAAVEEKVALFNLQVTSINNYDVIVPIAHFSDFNRLVRAQTAVVLAARYWISRARKEKCFDAPWKLEVDADGKEKRKIMSIANPYVMEKAELMVIRHVQAEVFGEEIEALKKGKLPKNSKLLVLSPFIKDGLLRVRGRISNADIPNGVKYPLILPAKHHVTELLILKEHQRNGHQGHATVLHNLRQRYWILDGRTAVSRAVDKCQNCSLKNAKPVLPKMGELPYYRLSYGQPAFTYTGVDLFGPLEVVVGRHHEKRWVSVFTCMVTRAIHLEVVYGLSTDEMMMAISRFVDQRGRPRHIYSDNGTNFVGTKKELHLNWESFDWSRIQNLDKFREISWHFNPPCSPHFGGAWERMVQAVKRILKKTMFEIYPKDQTLLTMLKGAENLINSRPLTYLSNDPADPEPLTPNHFLRGFCDVGPSVPGEYEPADEILRSQWRRAQYFLDLFWKRWTREVLPELSRRDKWHADVEPLGVGDIVLLVDDQCPRNIWKKGVVVAAFPGKDGQVRVVSVESSDFLTRKKSTFRRGVDKVVPLGLKMEKSGRFA